MLPLNSISNYIEIFVTSAFVYVMIRAWLNFLTPNHKLSKLRNISFSNWHALSLSYNKFFLDRQMIVPIEGIGYHYVNSKRDFMHSTLNERNVHQIKKKSSMTSFSLFCLSTPIVFFFVRSIVFERRAVFIS